MRKKYPVVTMSNGVEMPLLGLGTFLLTGEEGLRAVKEALRIGYRLIDTATLYENEDMIGEALEESYADGVVSREDIFLVTKLWLTDMHPDNQLRALERSLAKLRTSYVDLYLVHAPPFLSDDRIEDVWKGMEHLYDLGLCRAIGVSNFNFRQMERVRKTARIPIHCTQNELHIYLPQHDLEAYCKLHNIAIMSYSSLGSTSRANAVGLTFAKNVPSPLSDRTVLAIAERLKKTPAQVLLRYVIDRGIAVIPKATNPSRLLENFEAFNFHLSPSEMKQLGSLKQRVRYFVLEAWKDHPEYPFHNCPAAAEGIAMILNSQ